MLNEISKTDLSVKNLLLNLGYLNLQMMRFAFVTYNAACACIWIVVILDDEQVWGQTQCGYTLVIVESHSFIKAI